MISVSHSCTCHIGHAFWASQRQVRGHLRERLSVPVALSADPNLAPPTELASLPQLLVWKGLGAAFQKTGNVQRASLLTEVPFILPVVEQKRRSFLGSVFLTRLAKPG